MQVSRIVPSLLAVLGLVTPVGRAEAAAVQVGGRYRVTADNAWFYQDVAGHRIARIAHGAILTGGGATRNDWIQVTLAGWIFGTSVGRSDRPDFDLIVTRTPNENLRAAPAGPLVAELAQGFGLKRASPDSSGRWVHVTRDGWVQRSALAPMADVVVTRTVDSSESPADTGTARPTPGPRAATDSMRVDSTRAQPVRMTTLYRAPDGPEAGTIATETPLRAARHSERRVLRTGARAPPGTWFRVHRGAGDQAPGVPGPDTAYSDADNRTRAERSQPVPGQPRCRPDFARRRRRSWNAMNDILNERIRRKLDVMLDEQAYQVLDYIEFLESKYSQRSAGAPAFQKVAETLEDTMRAGRVPVTIIRGTMDAVGKAGKFFEGLAAAGKAAVEEATRKNQPEQPVEETKTSQ